ncbi:MAG TPA: Imm42 family immunity protein [Bryobacteraceae bacterium]|nr:Imm42 family immunity protein [Bryobacteraceae bacterium]
MIVGDASLFAIESGITQAYARVDLRGLGFFVIHVGGRRYGVSEPNATLLACSVDTVQSRIVLRGSHTAPFATEAEAGKIADAVRNAIYADEPNDEFFGLPLKEFCDLVYSNYLVWAPDGDEAFDDGSYVLQFDVQNRVRLIAFKCDEGYGHDPLTLRDVWIGAEDFYRILQDWQSAFECQWAALPKKDI